MEKYSYFASERLFRWPEPAEIEHYFLNPPGQRWFFETTNDSGGFRAKGADGTAHMPAGKGRINVNLSMWGHPDLGVLLIYSKHGGGFDLDFTSKGDMTKLREWVRSFHGTPLPVGLFIPYEEAWKAVKEFLETDGQLPKSIAWVANKELPPNTFPLPHEL
jgi:hypothetical protein